MQRNSPVFTVKKKTPNKTVVKITEEQCELSEFDKIVSGIRDKTTVYFED